MPNKVIDLETFVLLRAVHRGVITDPDRIEAIKTMVYDELENSEQDAEHRHRLEALVREMRLM